MKADAKNELKIIFIHSRLERWQDHFLRIDDENNSCKKCLLHIKDGRDAWIITAYLLLKASGINVEISEKYISGSICVAHYDDLRLIKYPYDSYVVSARADRERSFTCEKEIVQSPAAITNKNCYYLPHWPQPELIQRDQARENRVLNIGYFGTVRNLAACCRTESFNKNLDDIGVKLIIRESPEEWNDYSDIDIVLALRDGTDYFLASKPATKLFNAWLAGVPALVGNEPAYKHHIKDELDGLFVSNAEDIIQGKSCIIFKDDRTLQGKRKISYT